MLIKTIFLSILVLLVIVKSTEARRSMSSRSRSSGSGRGTGRRTNPNPQPAPTSISQPTVQKPSLSGWQLKPAQKTQTYKQSNPNNQGHSYPSSNTGLSGNNQQKQSIPQQEYIQKSNIPLQQSAIPISNNQGHSYPSSNTGLSGSNQLRPPASQQENVQRSNSHLQHSVQPVQNSQSGHSYPVSNGLSGNSGSGIANPHVTGLSGSHASPNPYPGANSNNNFRPQSYPTNHFNNNQPPPPYTSVGNNVYHHPQGPPPPYTNYGHSYGGYGGSYNQQSPGYFGGYTNYGKNFGGMSRTGNALTGVGIAGAGIGTVLTGLALWNLARSTGHRHHTVIYDNRGQPIAVAPENSTAPVEDPILQDLVNCTLTINNDNSTEVIAIPCSIATSFTPDANLIDVNMENNKQDNTKCTVTVVTKSGQEFMTTIPCSVLVNTAAENNVTEPSILINSTTTENAVAVTEDDKLNPEQPTALRLSNIAEGVDNFDALLNCTHESGEIRDPINPCFSVKHNLTVIPLQPNGKE